MPDRELEHPVVARLLRTGLPTPEPEPLGFCRVCGEAVLPGEAHGVWQRAYIHADCVDGEWAALTPGEKLTRLNWRPVFPV